MGIFTKAYKIVNKYSLRAFLSIVPLIVFLSFWEVLSLRDQTRMFLFSSPSRVLNSLIENISNGVLLRDTFVTGQEALLGFLLGNLLGAIIGLSLWYSKSVAYIAKPYIIAIGSIPIFSIAPMMIIWFGTGLYAKVMMAAISTIIIAITQSYEGAQNVDVNQIRLFQAFRATKSQIFFQLVVPSSLVWLFNSLRLNVGFALLGAFIAEFVSANEGLGHRILKAGGTYDISLVLASVICIVMLAFLFSSIVFFAEKTLMKWK